ncbi:hypothetical protein AVEN_151360-1 [Araneus ventricosus]|uniref:Uncharacterized protein n=1 Tax=Araneus ventricosus TaxID=182803 RepID=A0A4Y2CAZ4_ARAVE|nr:hypothetical protein AVEN_151360-1 [Araneus ventricosus]
MKFTLNLGFIDQLPSNSLTFRRAHLICEMKRPYSFAPNCGFYRERCGTSSSLKEEFIESNHLHLFNTPHAEPSFRHGIAIDWPDVTMTQGAFLANSAHGKS